MKKNKLISWGLGLAAGAAAFIGPQQDANAQTITVNCHEGIAQLVTVDLSDHLLGGKKH